jgi:hypothetical protein
MYKKQKKKKAKKQKFGRRRVPILGRLDKKSVALLTELWRRLGCKWLTTKYLYSDRHYESPNLELLGKLLIFRHDKHLNFYRTVLKKFLNYKSTELWQKPRTYWIRKLHHFNSAQYYFIILLFYFHSKGHIGYSNIVSFTVEAHMLTGYENLSALER